MNFLFEQTICMLGPVLPPPFYLTSPIIIWAVSLTVDIFLMVDGKSDFISELNNVKDFHSYSYNYFVKLFSIIYAIVCCMAGVMLGLYTDSRRPKFREVTVFLLILVILGGIILVSL